MTEVEELLQRAQEEWDRLPWWEKANRRIRWRWDEYNPAQLYREVKYFIQRGRRGYSDRDLWNLDTHIALQVLAFLDSERSGLTFSPRDGKKRTFEQEKAIHQRNKAEIRWLMEQHLNDYDGFEAGPEYIKRIERANRLFAKYWAGMWD